jgi:hypothetical protein
MSFRKLKDITKKLESISVTNDTFVTEPVLTKTLRVLKIISDEIDWKSMSDEDKIKYRYQSVSWVNQENEDGKYLSAIIELTETLIKKIEWLDLEISQTEDNEINIKNEILLAILLLEKELNLEHKNIDKLRHIDYYWFNDILSYFKEEKDVNKIQILFNRMYALWKNRPWNEIV